MNKRLCKKYSIVSKVLYHCKITKCIFDCFYLFWCRMLPRLFQFLYCVRSIIHRQSQISLYLCDICGMYLEAVFRFYVLLNHFVGHFFFGLVRFGSFSNTIYRNLALALSKLHINVDITVGFFVGQKNYRLPVRRLDSTVNYVMNKEKTTAVSLQDALDYAANRDKTEQSCFESSYACTLETAFADMRQTKERWHKSGGVQGYHLVQSFAAGEVSPELAHQIAKELAARVLGGRYEYVIGTHLNTGHIHSHIVWNSVSRTDGKKYHSNGKSYVTQIRAVSDELCRKYKLSVIDTENSNHVAKPYAEWLAEKNGQPTWRTAIRQDVDEAIQQSLTWRQFLNALERKGYEVRMGRKYPVLRPPGKERFVRFKTLGKRYTPEAIQTRILYPQSYHPYVENPPTIQHGRLRSGKKPCRKLTGLRALYYRYLYELGALPRKPRRPSYAVRQDAYKLDQRIRQMEFLSKNNIDTLAQLETHRQALQTEIGQLLTKRKQLPKTDDVQSQHESVNTALKQLRQEERLCRKIAEHSLEVQQHLTESRRDRAAQQQREQERARDLRPDITTR